MNLNRRSRGRDVTPSTIAFRDGPPPPQAGEDEMSVALAHPPLLAGEGDREAVEGETLRTAHLICRERAQ